jgi:type VI secretion system protein ImpJ
MPQVNRIVWSEGLFVTPHHFQQWDLFQEAQLAERLFATQPYPWGIHAMEWDAEALAGGSFRLLSFRALFPSGVSIRLPDFDPPPPSISFADAFGAKLDTIDVFIGLPHRRSGWPNCDLSEGFSAPTEEVRYEAKTVSVSDENTGRNDRPIQGARLRLKLLLSTEVRDNFECLPVARVARSPQGDYRLVPEFVPPLLSIQASPSVMRVCRSVHEAFTTRATELARRFTESGVDARDITPANLRAFLQFYCINSAIPRVAYCRETQGTSPQRLYEILAQTAGQLCTFHAGRFHSRDVPPYNHQALGTTFGDLEKMLRDLLKDADHDPYRVLPLVSVGAGQYEGALPAEYVFDTDAVLYLSLASEGMSDRSLLESAARVLVSSPSRLSQLVQYNRPGLKIDHVPIPPPTIPRRQGTVYFQLDNRGEHWDAIRASSSLAVKMPPALGGSQIELILLGGKR